MDTTADRLRALARGERAEPRRVDRPPRGGSPVSQVLFFAGVVVLWQAAGALELWESYLFPTPLEVGARLFRGLRSGAYLRGTWVTVLRMVQGYLISAAAAVALGVAIRCVPILDKTIGATIVGLQALPSVCWLPLSLLWFGLSQAAIIFVVVMGALLPITVATEQGIRNVPPIYIRAARTMGARGFALYARVMLPAALPSILTGMKLGWAFAWRSLMAAELLYVSGGLGQLLMMGREFNDIAEMVAVMVVIVAIGLLFNRVLFATVERRVRERFGLGRG